MKEKTTSSSSTKLQILKLGLIVTIVLLAITWIGYFAMYPTPSHRDINQQITEVLSLEPSQTLAQSEIDTRYDKLSATSEAQYSSRAGAVVVLVQILAYVGLTYYLYMYIRRKGLSRKVVGLVALIIAGASMVTSLVSWLIYDEGVSPAMFFATLPLSTVLVAVLSFVVASLCESWYKRRNSFEM